MVHNTDSNTDANCLPDTDNHYCKDLAVNSRPTSTCNENGGKIQSCAYDECD